MAEVLFTNLHPSCVVPSVPGGCCLWLHFDCPTCGPPYRINIPIILNGQGADRQPEIPKWTATTPDLGWDRLTVTPSINNKPPSGGHGRKRPCSFHGSIVDGKVVFPGAPHPEGTDQ